MTTPTPANLYTQGFGSRAENVEIPTFQTRAPASTDINWPLGKRWVNTSANSEYSLTSVSASNGALSANWTVSAGGSLLLSTLTGDSGGAISPSSGNITVAGTANQITTTGSGSTITWSLPSAITAPGSLTTTTGLTAGSGFTVSAGAVAITTGTSAINISADAAATTINLGTGAGAKTITIGSTNTTSATNLTAGSGGVNCATDFALTSVATKISMNGGAVTDFIGEATLVAGTVTVNNTNIAANDRILVVRSTTGGTEGHLSYTISAGASFTVTSSSNTDTSTVVYVIFRQT